MKRRTPSGWPNGKREGASGNDPLRVRCSGGSNGASGGVYLVDLETREEAERFIANDPLFQADLFERVSVTRWRKAYLDGECFL